MRGWFGWASCLRDWPSLAFVRVEEFQVCSYLALRARECEGSLARYRFTELSYDGTAFALTVSLRYASEITILGDWELGVVLQ